MYGVILYSFVNAGVVFAQDDPASDSLSTEEITKDADILERD